MEDGPADLDGERARRLAGEVAHHLELSIALRLIKEDEGTAIMGLNHDSSTLKLLRLELEDWNGKVCLDLLGNPDAMPPGKLQELQGLLHIESGLTAGGPVIHGPPRKPQPDIARLRLPPL